MCLICVEFEMSRLTVAEARRNLREMASSIDEEHIEEIEKLLTEKEIEQMDDEESSVRSSKTLSQTAQTKRNNK